VIRNHSVAVVLTRGACCSFYLINGHLILGLVVVDINKILEVEVPLVAFPTQRCNVTVIGNKVILSRCSGARGKVKGEESDIVGCPVELSEEEAEAKRLAGLRRSCKRSYNRVLDITEGMGADRMMTLTFQENVVDLDIALVAWGVFVRLLYAQIGRLDYLCVPERQARGAVHFHVLLNKYVPWEAALKLWRQAVSEVSSLTGGIDVRKKKVSQRSGESAVCALARYVAKYVSKEFYCGAGWGVGRRRYYSNVAVEKTVVSVLDSDDSIFICNDVRGMYGDVLWQISYKDMLERILGKKLLSAVKKWSFVSVFSGFLYRIDGVFA
jgi:hypothetical protein